MTYPERAVSILPMNPRHFEAFGVLKNLLLAFFLLTLFTPAGSAAFFEPSPWVKKSPYTEKIGCKLGFGVLNFGTGWTALMFEPTFGGGFWKGLGRGIFFTITNTAGGALHALTFPIPLDIPLPHGGVQFYDKTDK